MSPQPRNATTVRITSDGTCFIDDEYFAPPAGAAINAAVLEHLRLEAAALEEPLEASITDEQSDYSVTILVRPDGSSAPASNARDAPSSASHAPRPSERVAQREPGEDCPPHSPAIALRRPYESLPEPHRTRLQTACASIEAGSLTEATTSVDAIIAELSDAFGPYDRHVVAAGIVRGDIALISHDHEYGLRIWAFIAETWQRIIGTNDATTIPLVGNALWCWSQLSDATALNTWDTITTLLHRVPVPGSESSLQNVHRRLQQLAKDRSRSTQ